jgi:hypothetical protein
MKLILISVFIIFFVNYANAEQKKTENGLFTIEVLIEKGDLKVGENKPIELILHDASGNSLEGADIKVTPWMTEHGHGSNKQTQVKEKGNGLYIIENIYLTMKGKWDLIIEIRYSDKEDSVVISLPKVR